MQIGTPCCANCICVCNSICTCVAVGKLCAIAKKATPWWQKFKSCLRLWCIALGKMATGQLTLQNWQLVCGKCVQRRLVCGVQMHFVLAKLGTRGAKLAILSASVRNACNVLRLHPSELWNCKKKPPRGGKIVC